MPKQHWYFRGRLGEHEILGIHLFDPVFAIRIDLRRGAFRREQHLLWRQILNQDLSSTDIEGTHIAQYDIGFRLPGGAD